MSSITIDPHAHAPTDTWQAPALHAPGGAHIPHTRRALDHLADTLHRADTDLADSSRAMAAHLAHTLDTHRRQDAALAHHLGGVQC